MKSICSRSSTLLSSLVLCKQAALLGFLIPVFLYTDCSSGFICSLQESFAQVEGVFLNPFLQLYAFLTASKQTGNPELKVNNITDLTKKSMKILDLQGKTSYQLELQAYTAGGLSPPNSLYVVTKEDCKLIIPVQTYPLFLAQRLYHVYKAEHIFLVFGFFLVP